jgi:hypothetical protein
MTYKEINPTEWTYEKEGDFIEGVLVRKQSNIGENNSMLYSIDTKDGIKNVWGATILDLRMNLVAVESKIRITFLGLSKEVKKGKNPAKIFKVEVEA